MPFICPTLPCQLHATCVSLEGRGLLIIGSSGAGKSRLALELMALGAELVADDQCYVTSNELGVVASRPYSLPQAIEVRGIGLMAAHCVETSLVSAVLDLDVIAQERLPHLQYIQMGDCNVPLLQLSKQTSMPAALFHFLKYGFHGSMVK